MSILVVLIFWLLKNNIIINIYMHAWTELMCAKSFWSCLTLCDSMDRSLPGSSLSMEFSRLEYWNGLPCSPPGDLPDPGIKPASLMSLALAGSFFTISTTWEAPSTCMYKFSLGWSGIPSRSGIAGSYSNYIFNILRKCQAVFQRCHTILPSH